MKALDMATLKVGDIILSFDDDDIEWYQSEVIRIDHESEKVYFKDINNPNWGELEWDDEWYNINDIDHYRES